MPRRKSPIEDEDIDSEQSNLTDREEALLEQYEDMFDEYGLDYLDELFDMDEDDFYSEK